MTDNNVDTICLDPPAPSLDATHLNTLMQRYIEASKQRAVDKATTVGYINKLRWFAEWWEIEGPARGWRLTPNDMLRFELYLRDVVSSATHRKLAYNTRQAILDRLGGVFAWAFENHYVQRNYSKWIPSANGAPPKRKAATIEMLYRLIQCVESTRYPERDKTILALLIGMGLRRAEVAALNVESIVVEADFSGYAKVTGKRTPARPDGIREAAFDSATGGILVEYLDDIDRISGPLFVSQLGQRMCGNTVYKVVKKAIDAANLNDYIIGPHDLRRAFATHNWRVSKDIKLLQGQLGHSDPAQTWKYTLIGVDDIRVDLVSPIALLGK